MTKFLSRFRRNKKVTTLLLLCAGALVFPGCQIGYYSQAVRGQLQMWSGQKPMLELVEKAETPDKLKEKFELIFELRRYAEKELGLATEGHYLNYVDLHRSNVVWNVYAAPELSLESKRWWYPVVGSLSYRGYFSEVAAEKYAAKLRKKDYDVYVGGVDAYSTLGWFKDPVLNTFIDSSNRRLASLIFHELAHQRLFASGDTEFNEAFATAVGEEGLRRWLESRNDAAGLEKYRAEVERKGVFIKLIQSTREELLRVYEGPGDVASKRQRKEVVINGLRQRYQELKKEWNGYDGYDEWFEGPLNNAQLNTISTYYNLVPAFHRLMQQNGGDFEKFYKAAEKFTRLSKEERHRQLQQLLHDSQVLYGATSNM
jgi:predicted aminopeptidase